MRWIVGASAGALIALAAVPMFAEVVLTVAKDGSAKFATVQAAIDAIPPGGTVRYVVHIAPGIYEERITIPQDKPCVTLRGEDPNATLITYELGASEPGPDGEPIGTFATATAYILADDCVVEDLAFENVFGEGAQALAVSARADRLVFRNCRLLGWQDTLFADGGRQYYVDCIIEGHCDYLFGNAAAFFENCILNSLDANYITAHGRTDETQPTGFVFKNCQLLTPGTAQGVYLGRPWRPYARVVFLDCWMGDGIRPEGWHDWKDPNRRATVFYAEYNSSGPGADPSGRVDWSRQLTAAEAETFDRTTFLAGDDGWDPLAPPAASATTQPAGE